MTKQNDLATEFKTQLRGRFVSRGTFDSYLIIS